MNKKKFVLMLLALSIMFMFPSTAFTASDKCTAVFGNDITDPNTVGYWIQLSLDIIKYLAIIALIVLSTFDFVKALVAQNDDALKKAYKTAIKRLIYCVIIFFIPGIVKLLFTVMGWYGNGTPCYVGLE